MRAVHISAVLLQVSEIWSQLLLSISDRPLMASEDRVAHQLEHRAHYPTRKRTLRRKAWASAPFGGKGNCSVRFHFHKLLRKLANAGLSLRKSGHTITDTHMTCLLLQRTELSLHQAPCCDLYAFRYHDIQVGLYLESILLSKGIFFYP